VAAGCRAGHGGLGWRTTEPAGDSRRTPAGGRNLLYTRSAFFWEETNAAQPRRPLAIGCVLLAAGLAQRATASPAGASPDDAPYQSAKTCAECHETIHLYWSESAHAKSATDPAYLEALEDAVKGAASATAVRRECSSCHAPTSLVTGDVAAEQPITKEGVTCDFCHTVADVRMGAPDHPFVLDPGPVKRGPLDYAKSDFHQTAYSVLHKASPLLCASCHEWTNPLGVKVLSTWSEWREGPYPARGETCQECHMPLVPGESVGEGLTASRRVVNLHRMQGGSTASKLRSGLGLDVRTLSASATATQVEVVVRNRGVGHAVPGGLGHDELVLVVGVDAGGSGLANPHERVYRRVLLDAEGQPLVRVADLFQRAASIGEDSRIGPGQSRTERFTLPLPEGWRAVVARLEFRDTSRPGSEPVSILEERRGR